MALRAQKPMDVQKRFKVLLYGAAGAGKTYASIQFPSPYLIDTERGAENSQYIKILEENNGAIFQTNDFSEIFTEVKSLLTEKHNYKTLVIDPLTTVYSSLLDSCALKLSRGGKDGTEMGRHYSEANKQLKRLFNMLFRLDMNVIITSHAKSEYGSNMSVIGQTFDCYKKMDYLFDLSIEVQKGPTKRIGIVKKSRISSFVEGDTFDFSYGEMALRYGRDIIEKESESKTLASKEQVNEISNLIDMLRVPAEVVEKWLSKSESSCFEDMDKSVIQKCIDSLRKKEEEREQGVSGSDKIAPITEGRPSTCHPIYQTIEYKGRHYD